MTGREGRASGLDTVGLAARWNGKHKWVLSVQKRYQCKHCGFTKAEARAWQIWLCPGDALTNRGFRADKRKPEVVVWEAKP
jgi:ribosomal protein L37AE/L43A